MTNSYYWKSILGLVILGLTLTDALDSVAHAAGPLGTLDIVIVMDSSTSIGSQGWDVETIVVESFVEQSRPVDSRIGIIQFASDAHVRHAFSDDQTEAGIVATVGTLSFSGGYGKMVTALQEAINQFNAQSSPENHKLILFISDGTPSPSREDPCGTRGLEVTDTLTSLGINVVIVGVGDQWSPSRIDCLVGDPTTDIFEAYSLTADSFDFDRFRTAPAPPAPPAPTASLTVAQSGLPAASSISFSVTVNNEGTGDAQNVVVAKTLPNGVTFAASDSCVEGDPGALTCSLGTILAGDSRDFSITVNVDAQAVGLLDQPPTVESDP